MLFQMMFAIITPALITGAFAERKKFSAFLRLHRCCGRRFVYDPLAHWVWGDGGWLQQAGRARLRGRHRRAHLARASRRSSCALVLGKRKGYGHQPMQPHNLPLTVIGAGLLWFGWFGFNAGSALGGQRPRRAARSSTTNTAAAAAALGWMFTEWIVARQADRARRRLRRGRRAGRDHAGGGLRDARWRRSSSARWRASSATRACNLQVEARLRRLARRGRRARRRRHVGRARHRPLRHQGRSTRRAATACFYGNPGQLWIQIVAVAATLRARHRGDSVILKVVDASWACG